MPNSLKVIILRLTKMFHKIISRTGIVSHVNSVNLIRNIKGVEELTLASSLQHKTSNNKFCGNLKIVQSCQSTMAKVQDGAYTKPSVCSPVKHLFIPIRHYAKKGKKDRGGDKKKGSKIDLSAEELSQVINHQKMQIQMMAVLEELQKQYMSQLKLRTTAGAFDQLIVETDDGKFPLIQIAQITQKNPSLVMIDLTVMPQYLVQVKEAIMNSGMNVSPQQDGTTFFVPIPKVSREHREGLAKSAKVLCNSSKDKLRDIQNKFVKDCKQKQKENISSDLVNNVIEYVRNVHGEFVSKAEELMKSKQQELLGK